MGIAACMCTCLACYRMAEGIDEEEERKRVLKKKRSRRIPMTLGA